MVDLAPRNSDARLARPTPLTGDALTLLGGGGGPGRGGPLEGGEVVRAIAVVHFLDGTQPYMVSLADGTSADASVEASCPSGARLLRLHDKKGLTSAAVEGDGWRMYLFRMPMADDRWLVSGFVAAESEGLARRLADEFEERHPSNEPRDDGRVPVGLWMASAMGPHRSSRRIEAPTWEAIAANYPAGTRAALDRLVRFRSAESHSGGLVLLHGEAGTGKTTLLRSLARAWADWCGTDVVIDPERFLGDPAYLMDVLLQREGRNHGELRTPVRRPWRLVVVEDAGDLLAAGESRTQGQAFGRLLNATDGIIGRGTRTLVAVSTNLPAAALHPALTRPGRCLATIQFERFARREAREWLAGRAPAPGGDATLAELYEAVGGIIQIAHAGADVPAGSYL